MSFEGFDPAVRAWFTRSYATPTDAQARGWQAIQRGHHTLIAAPTGSGKTLAAFLCAIDELVRMGSAGGGLEDATHVVYVSPLKALGNDIESNLQRPLAGIRDVLAEHERPDVAIRTAVRTGDTPTRERTAAAKHPPHLFVTTPESLHILLTTAGGRHMLRTARTVIVDEIHALAGTKRGAHMALSLERLEALTEHELTRIGLSATQKPIEEVARFLVGSDHVDSAGTPQCTIVDTGHQRTLDVDLEVPSSPLEAVMAGEVWEEIYDRIATHIRAHATTLVFVNTRRLAERLTRQLCDRLGNEAVTAHHGSMDRERRLDAERRLRAGSLRALVATASLELGIDVGDVDLVCQIGSPRNIATLVQRVGRAGHALGRVPKGRVFPLTRDELIECAALLDALRRGELDRLHVPDAPLDILAQQLVATVASAAPAPPGRRARRGADGGPDEAHRSEKRDPEAGSDPEGAVSPDDEPSEQGWREADLYALACRAWPYRALRRRDFDAVVEMLSDGVRTSRGQRGRWLHRDMVHGRLRARRGARTATVTSGGAIPDTADYDVVVEPEDTRVGTVNEDFAIESMAGDVFQLGNASYRIRRVEPGRVRVEDAQGEPPSIPFWLGEAPARSDEASAAVARLRGEIAARLEDRPGAANASDAARQWAETVLGIPHEAAVQVVDHLATAHAALGAMPTQRTVVLERFFDETGSMHLVLHAPLGSRLTRAWGLALRKRLCRRFNVELQAAATEDAVVLSLGPTHSFPTDALFSFVKSATVREVLVQAVLDAPMFATRWRWNVTRALAVLRFRQGRKVAPQIQRIEADDLRSVVFPDQVACLENVPGDRTVPDHPLVAETLRDCLDDWLDVSGLASFLARLERGEITALARELTAPSPLAQETLNARPYAFLDDAPLEERRTQAIQGRRWLDPQHASELGALDADAIARVVDEAWPDAANADEVHDALLLHGAITEPEATEAGWAPWLDALRDAGRATVIDTGGMRAWVAAERITRWRKIHPRARFVPPLAAPTDDDGETRDDAVREIVRGRLEMRGPVTANELAAPLGLDPDAVDTAVASLEQEGTVVRGRFRPDAAQEEYCERRLLARIHRYTLGRLRSEIEPVAAAYFMRFVIAWQHASPGSRREGPGGLDAVLDQLEGFEAAAGTWEGDLLPLRLEEYDPVWLDTLCLSGRVAWARRSPARHGTTGPVRSSPMTLVARERLPQWLAPASGGDETAVACSADAAQVLAYLRAQGASFFADITSGTGLLRSRVEDALGELVCQGLVTSDGFSGLRALIVPSSRRRASAHAKRRRTAVFGMESAGRWSTLPSPAEDRAAAVETVARTLLRRWGVVFRQLLQREGPLPPWRELLDAYHRLEARGEIRGGRFVAGFTGEQFAMPEAIPALRAARRRDGDTNLVSVSASDPLNLVGIVTPGRRVPAVASNRVLYRDGVPVAVRENREVRLLETVDEATRWQLERALGRRNMPVQVRAYLG